MMTLAPVQLLMVSSGAVVGVGHGVPCGTTTSPGHKVKDCADAWTGASTGDSATGTANRSARSADWWWTAPIRCHSRVADRCALVGRSGRSCLLNMTGVPLRAYVHDASRWRLAIATTVGDRTRRSQHEFTIPPTIWPTVF